MVPRSLCEGISLQWRIGQGSADSVNRTEYFKVVGVRANATREVLCRQVTQQQADRIKTLLDNDTVFISIEIELDIVSSPELDLRPDL